MLSGSSVNKEPFFFIINETWLACAFWSAKEKEEIVGRGAESSHWPFSKIMSNSCTLAFLLPSSRLSLCCLGDVPATLFKTAQQLWH